MTLNRQDIMRQAWATFRSKPSWWQTGSLRSKTFSDALRKAWAWAKFNAECARKDAVRKAEEARRVVDAPAVLAIRKAIDELQFKSFRYDITAERRELETKLAAQMAA